LLAQDPAELAFEIEHLRGGKHRVRVAEAEEPAPGEQLVSAYFTVAHRNDRLEMRGHGALRHQLIELNERECPVARVVLNRLWAAVRALLIDAENMLLELYEVAVALGAGLRDANAINRRAIRAAQVAQ